MADVDINKFRASVVRDGSKPASPGFVVSEGQDPVDPAGTGQNHLPVTIATAATGLSITESQVLGGAGTVGQYIRGDGSLADFPESSGGGSSISYYLNGSISQGTIGGVAYKELNKVPVLGAGTDFTIAADGYIASFLTDAGDPNLLEIPGGNWTFETYFSASSGGGSPTFYVELYKYNGTTFTLIASNSTFPELIAFGTNIISYFSTLAVPTTALALTDRLAIRYYVTHSGRTITLHTEDNHLCQIITTFTTGITALNGLTAQVQNFAVGTSGTDFAIASATATHTFNLPTASATNRGALSAADWTTFNNKENAITAGTTAQYFRGDKTFQTLNTGVVPESSNLYYTDARSRAALSFAAGSGAYNSGTGVITIPTNNNQITNGAGYITSASSITGASGALTSRDNRTISPSEDNVGQLKFGFTSWANNDSAPYADYLHLRSYIDSSGGNDNLVMFLKSAIGMRIYQQSFGSATAYSSFKDIAFTDGTNATGTWGINITGNAGTVTNGVYTSRTITINGTTQDLSANRTFNVGTVTSVSASSPLFSSGGNTPNITIQQASGSQSGFLSSTDWNTFNNKTSNVGTVTSVAALTLGTAGTDLSSSVANSTTTPVITLNVPTASAANRGALSAADWTTFNGKQPALNGTGFVKISGTTISYDNSTYLTTGTAASTYLPLTGGTLTGALNGTSASFTGNIESTSLTASIVAGRTTGYGYFGNLTGGAYSIVYGDFHATKPNRVEISGAGGVYVLNAATFSGVVTSNGSSSFSGYGLTTKGTYGLYVQRGSTNDSGVEVYHDGTNAIINSTYQITGSFGGMLLYTGGLPRLTLASTGAATFSGNVGIGGGTPSIFTPYSVATFGSLSTTNNGITIASTTTGNGLLEFADGSGGGSASYRGYIQYAHTSDSLIFGTSGSNRLTIGSTGNVLIGSSVTASSFIKSGGTSLQFLKADGSVDSNTYLTSSSGITGSGTSGFIPILTGATTIANSKINAASSTIYNVNPTAGQYAWSFGGSTTTGQSYGAVITGGTNSSDMGFKVMNAAATVNYFVVRGDGHVGIGTNVPATSALLDVTSTTKGFLPPRMTTLQKNAIASPQAGLVIYDTTLNKLCVRVAAAWQTVTSA